MNNLKNNIDISNMHKYDSVKLTNSLDENINIIKEILKGDDTIKYKTIMPVALGGKRCTLVFCEPMIDDKMLSDEILKPMFESSSETLNDGEEIWSYLSNKRILSSEFLKSSSVEHMLNELLYGKTLLVIDGEKDVGVLNTNGWEARAISEPQSESTVRGPKDGFNEVMQTNISLIRRRITTPQLKFKYRELGRRTKTKLCICYIEGIVHQKILDELNRRLDSIDIDGILDSGYIEEIIRDSPLSVCKLIGSSERPDIICGRMLEGRIALICDGSPEVLTVPHVFIECFQASEDYYNNYLVSSLNRFIRYIAFILSVCFPALFLSWTTYHQELIPTQLLISISQARIGVPFPTVIEITVMLFIFEILREAGTRLPKVIGQAVSIVGALVLGDAAVNARLVSAPIVIVAALTGIASFLTPQIIGSTTLLRIIMLLLSTFLGLYGLIFGVVGLFIHMFSTKSFGVPHMLNTSLLNFQDLNDAYIRMPWWLMKQRPKFSSSNIIRNRSSNGSKKNK